MKKTYMQPRTLVVKIKSENMICASDSVPMSATNYNGEATIESKDDFDFSDDLW